MFFILAKWLENTINEVGKPPEIECNNLFITFILGGIVLGVIVYGVLIITFNLFI